MAIINMIYRQIIMCIIYDGPFSVAKSKITRRYLSPSSPSPDCVPTLHLPGPSFCRPPRCFPQGPKSTPEPWLEGSQANKRVYIYIDIITCVIPYEKHICSTWLYINDHNIVRMCKNGNGGQVEKNIQKLDLDFSVRDPLPQEKHSNSAIDLGHLQ